MSQDGLRRPSQVTLAGGMGVAGALIFVISLFDAMRATRTVNTRNVVDDLLAQPPWDGTGLTVDEMLELIRFGLFGMGAAAAVAFVFAIYVFQRNNAARIGFTVAAVLVLPGLVGTMGLGLASIMLGTAALWLWSEPARDWFAGRAPRSRERRRRPTPLPPFPHQPPWSSSEQPPRWSGSFGGAAESPQQQDSGPDASADERPDAVPPTSQEPPSSPPPPADQPPPGPPPSAGQGQHAPQPYPYGYGYGQPYPPQWPQQPASGQPPYGAPGWPPGYGTPRRPASVIWAVVLTWVSAGLTALLMAVVLLLLATNAGEFEQRIDEQIRSDRQLRDLGISTDQLTGYVAAICAGIAVWCLIAIVLAVFAYRRATWARALLAASAAASTLVSLVTILSLVSLVTLVPSAITVVLLLTRSASDWYAGRPPAPPGAPPPGRQQPW